MDPKTVIRELEQRDGGKKIGFQVGVSTISPRKFTV